ncbi:MAG TPA: 2-dehydropantoate 2-reductase [Kofleriaceae bacterium]|nr:2-dehydropantoate 2-reductase [Kofleriaceae bacterium]
MRFVIYGAGAVGGTIAGRLAQRGHELAVIARGAHGAAIRDRGLTVRGPDDEITVRVPVVEHPRELVFDGDELVILAMKSQDTVPALDALAAVAPSTITVACAQNGVANEREALRRFAHVIAAYVWMPALHVEPGCVEIACAPRSGYVDVGRFPTGTDDTTRALAAALDDAGFESVARDDIMQWKYKKLLTNLGNAIEAACGSKRDDPAARELDERARNEGARVLAAAGIAWIDDVTEAARRDDRVTIRPVRGRARPGGSSWQSLARGTGSIEADHLNGEIVLLGRLHGTPAPVNTLLQQVANQLARDRKPPGSVAARDLLARL